jgi:glutamate-1-semialdehyde 2,1-aminomutase
MGNGHPAAAVLGKARVMNSARESFVSSTAWTDRVGPVASLATIRKFRALDVGKHLAAMGARVQSVWSEAAQKAQLPIDVSGMPPLSHFELKVEDSAAAHTLFTQLLLDRGYLATNSFYASLPHTPAMIDAYGDAVCEAFQAIAAHVEDGSLRRALRGPVREAGFSRLT